MTCKAHEVFPTSHATNAQLPNFNHLEDYVNHVELDQVALAPIVGTPLAPPASPVWSTHSESSPPTAIQNERSPQAERRRNQSRWRREQESVCITHMEQILNDEGSPPSEIRHSGIDKEGGGRQYVTYKVLCAFVDHYRDVRGRLHQKEAELKAKEKELAELQVWVKTQAAWNGWAECLELKDTFDRMEAGQHGSGSAIDVKPEF